MSPRQRVAGVCWWCQCGPDKGEKLVTFDGDQFHSECLDEHKMFERAYELDAHNDATTREAWLI